MKRLKIVLYFVLLMSILQAQDSLKLEWAKDIITPYNVYDLPGDMVLDNKGAVYITGSTGRSIGGYRIVTVKFSPDGMEEWIKYDKGIDSTLGEAERIGIDKNKNIYVSGRTYTDSTSYDYYLIKYDSVGNEVWKTSYDGGITDYAQYMDVNEEGNTVITGWAYKGPQKCLTVRFNSSGEIEWANWYEYNDTSDDKGYGVEIDESGNVYVIGGIQNTSPIKSFLVKYNTKGEVDWSYNKDRVFGFKVFHNYNNNLYGFYFHENISFSKYDDNGNNIWDVYFTDSLFNFTTSASIIVDESNIYIAGYNGSSAILKFNCEGNLKWISDTMILGIIQSLDIDENRNIYAAAIDGDGESIIVAKYDSLGKMQHKLNYSIGEENYYFVKNALLDKDGNFYVFGYKEPDIYHRTMILLKYKLDPITGIEEEPEEMSKEFALYQNYPNPFNPSTTIKYELKETTNLTLKVYDSLGRLIKVLEEGTKPAGRYELQFDGSNLSSGIYFYQLKGDDFSFVKKMLLIK